MRYYLVNNKNNMTTAMANATKVSSTLLKITFPSTEDMTEITEVDDEGNQTKVPYLAGKLEKVSAEGENIVLPLYFNIPEEEEAYVIDKSTEVVVLADQLKRAIDTAELFEDRTFLDVEEEKRQVVVKKEMTGYKMAVQITDAVLPQKIATTDKTASLIVATEELSKNVTTVMNLKNSSVKAIDIRILTTETEDEEKLETKVVSTKESSAIIAESVFDAKFVKGAKIENKDEKEIDILIPVGYSGLLTNATCWGKALRLTAYKNSFTIESNNGVFTGRLTSTVAVSVVPEAMLNSLPKEQKNFDAIVIAERQELSRFNQILAPWTQDIANVAHTNDCAIKATVNKKSIKFMLTDRYIYSMPIKSAKIEEEEKNFYFPAKQLHQVITSMTEEIVTLCFKAMPSKTGSDRSMLYVKDGNLQDVKKENGETGKKLFYSGKKMWFGGVSADQYAKLEYRFTNPDEEEETETKVTKTTKAKAKK